MYAPILAVYQAQYKTRFIWNKINAATYHAMIAFIPKDEVKLTETQIKALLAYLNSSFTQLYIESIARTTGMGVAALEVKNAKEIPIIDVSNLDENNLRELADLFDKLDSEARRLGGADKRENIIKLWDTTIVEIDYKIADILGLSRELADGSRALAKIMMERRLQRAQEARPQAIRGEEEEYRPQKLPTSRARRRRMIKEDKGQTHLNGILS